MQRYGSKPPRVRLNWRAAFRGSRSGTGERGAELLEFALVLTALLMLLFGIMGFGHALYAYHFVSNAAREGTRYAIVRGSASTLTPRICTGAPGNCPPDQSTVDTYLKNVPAGIDRSALQPVATTCQNNSCDPGNWVQIQVQYTFQFVFPLLPSPAITMTSSSQMVISQ